MTGHCQLLRRGISVPIKHRTTSYQECGLGGHAAKGAARTWSRKGYKDKLVDSSWRCSLARGPFAIKNDIMSTIVREIKATHDSKAYEQSTTIIVTFGKVKYWVDRAPARGIIFRLLTLWMGFSKASKEISFRAR